jgi:type I restriction enzyme S subunit
VTIFKLVPLKHLCREPVAYGSNISSESYSSTGIRFLRTTDITDRGDLLPPDRGVYVDERLVRDSLLQDGDLLLSRSGTIGRSILFREAVHGPCAHAGYLVRFRPRPDIDPRWLFYFSKTSTFSDQIAEDVVESTIANFNGQKFANLAVPLPPRDCQYRIADFLDRKTASIDTLIAKQEQLLELLAEKRQALITQAVTKGLDPNVPMKDSGSDVLPSIPQGWSLIPLRYLLSFGPRNGISPPPATADGALSFSISAVRDGKVSIEGNEKFVELDHATARSYWLAPGDILLMRGNGNLSLVGTCGLVEHVPAECTYPDILMRMRVGRRLLAEFLVAAINSPYVRGQVETLAKTANGTFKVSREDVRTLQVAVPPLDEQERIVAHVQSELDRLDALSQRIQTMIDKLREYRQALITAAVTGQLDVTPTIHSERRPSPQAEAV